MRYLLALGCLFMMFLPLVRAQGELKPYTGPALPPFTLTDLQGRVHSLSDYRGQVVVVNFWATWCLPCVKEMPSMQRLKDRLADRPFTILAVNMAESEGNIETFLYRIKVDFPILMDKEGDVRKAWRVFAFPTPHQLRARRRGEYPLRRARRAGMGCARGGAADRVHAAVRQLSHPMSFPISAAGTEVMSLLFLLSVYAGAADRHDGPTRDPVI